MATPTQAQPPVLTKAGREDARRRLDAALEAMARLSDRMSGGERGPDEVAEHRRLLAVVEQLTATLNRSADVGSVVEDPTIVEVGDEVVIESADGTVETLALVHPVEATDDERISIDSPLGRALLGARPGDSVTVNAPAGPYTCTVVTRQRLA